MQTQQISERVRVFYWHLFNHILSSLSLLKEPVVSKEPVLWDSRIAVSIDKIAAENGYRSYKKNSTVPEVFLLGYDLSSADSIGSYLESLAYGGILQGCAFVAEGYDGTAVMMSRTNPATNKRLNHIFGKYRIEPKGNDSFELREQQYARLQELVDLMDGSHQNEKIIREKVQEAMSCLVRRERDYFLPIIVKHHDSDIPVIFLSSMIHTVSFVLPQLLNNTGIKYASFVPNT